MNAKRSGADSRRAGAVRAKPAVAVRAKPAVAARVKPPVAGPARIRLAKLLAQRGIAARRKAEDLIASGAVTVNGEVAAVVTLVDPETDIIAVNGEPLPSPSPLVYYLLDKPAGYITSRRDPQGRPSVLDFCTNLPVRVEPVGRLDYDTWGALLLTNDGTLAHRLTHPSRQIPKRYAARVEGMPDADTLRALETGIALEDGRTAPARVRVLGEDISGNARLEITVTEGRNRLVRRMLMKVGHPVLSLRREAFAGITTRGMKRGDVRPLTPREIWRLRRIAGIETAQVGSQAKSDPNRRGNRHSAE